MLLFKFQSSTKSFTKFFTFFSILFGISIAIIPSTSWAAPEVVPQQYIIKFRNSISSNLQSSIRSNLHVNILNSNKLTGSQLVQVTSGEKINDQYAKNLIASGEVDYFEPNYIYTINNTPNDSRYAELWGLNNTGQTGGSNDVDIDAPEAWNLTTGSSDVVVGIVDTGILYTHPDLANNIWVNPGEIPGNNIDDDDNGVIDDVYGYNSLNDSGDPLDDHGHGSHCAGTIGGTGNNSTGVVGVNWNVKIMGLKFLSSSGSGTTADAIKAIEYAVNMKNRGVNIRVLSNSWGGGGFSQALEDAITLANNAGILFVAAAGNSTSDNDSSPNYPSNYELENLLAVAAVDHNGNLASFSNFGATSVDVAAPGVNILSSILNNSYAAWSGTSMATPHVSGIAALILSREPQLSTTQLKTRILTTVKPLSSLNGLIASPGIVSAYNALTNHLAPAPPAESKTRYSKKVKTFNYDSNLGTKVLEQDDGYVAEDLGFSFHYYNRMYSRIAISANGRIVPLSDSDSLPTTPDYNNRLANGIHVYNDDFVPTPVSFGHSYGGIWFKTDDSSATVTWSVISYSHRTSLDPNTEIRFQAKLFPSGLIEFNYLDLNTGDSQDDLGLSATVGLAPTGGDSGEKITVIHNSIKPDEVNTNKTLSFHLIGGNPPADFDGDGKSDLIVWRPTTGQFFILTSGTSFSFKQHKIYQLGLPGDIPKLGDFDGDGRTDLAVWRPSNGTWYFRTSISSYKIISSMQWGLSGDIPLVGDFDGDKLKDLSVYRPNSGTFFSLLSSNGYNREAALQRNSQAMLSVELGGPANDPLIGDFTGDGRDDFVAIWQLIRFWSVKNYGGTLVYSLPWGVPGDTPLSCDWDGDGVSDRIMVRIEKNNSLIWYAITNTGLVYTKKFGSLGDIPSCEKDFDGDGKVDKTIFRTYNGQWFILESSSGKVIKRSFGLPGDIPL